MYFAIARERNGEYQHFPQTKVIFIIQAIRKWAHIEEIQKIRLCFDVLRWVGHTISKLQNENYNGRSDWRVYHSNADQILAKVINFNLFSQQWVLETQTTWASCWHSIGTHHWYHSCRFVLNKVNRPVLEIILLWHYLQWSRNGLGSLHCSCCADKEKFSDYPQERFKQWENLDRYRN